MYKYFSSTRLSSCRFKLSCLLKFLPDVDACVRCFARSDLLRRTLHHDGSAAVSAVRSEIDDVISRLDYVEIVLYDHDGVPVLRKTLQNIDKLMDIRKMETCRRFIKNIDRLARGSL